MSNIFNKDNASIEPDPKLYYSMCDIVDCNNRAMICVNAYDYVTMIGKNNNLYLCPEHFTKIRHLMKADREKIKKRYEFEKTFMEKFRKKW